MTTEYNLEGASLNARVRQALAEVLSSTIHQHDDATPLRDIPEARYDSMTVLECVGSIEQAFDISIDVIDDDLTRTFRSIATIQALVEQKLADQAALNNSWLSSKVERAV